jgi:pyruvate/2-oxoglutarate dehydrogenase complex dihydrolipoamide dehydrogenase (E3) component
VLLFEQFAVEAAMPPAIRLFDRTPVWSLFPGSTITASRDGEPVVETVDAIILATGSHDRAVPFAGGSQPGVITASALHRLVSVYRLLPGQRFVVIGDGDDAGSVIECIESASGEVVAQISESVARTMTGFGPSGIERVEVSGRSIEADIVVVAAGRIPDLSVAAMAECELCFDPSTNAWVVGRNETLESSAVGIWVAGDVAGRTDTTSAEAEGRYAAAQVARRFGAINDAKLSQERGRFERSVLRERRMAHHERHAVRQPWTPEVRS